MQAAVRAGLGVGLMATLGQGLDGLVARPDLPRPRPVVLSVWPRRGLRPDLTESAAGTLLGLMAHPPTVHA
jgi:DNA-binding transcriptional LysR family regulator